jgi:hypothetical protein
MSLREISKNLSILALTLVVVVVLLECAVRGYSYFAFPKMMEIDDQLGWRHAPNRERTFVNELGEAVLMRQNNYGLRGADYDPAQTLGKSRVLVLGDSFTEAVQVSEEQTFVGRLNKLHPELQVLNAGVGGYGTVQEYLYLELHGKLIRPAAVLLAIYENDLTDNCLSYYPSFGPRPYAFASAGSVTVVKELQPDGFRRFILPVPFWQQLNKHSYLYSFLNGRIYQRLQASKMRELEREDLRQTDRCGRMAVLESLLVLLKARTQELGAKLGVVIIPSEADARSGRSETSDAILKMCEARQLSCLALVASLHNAMLSNAKPYFKHDIHWTAEGHATAAQEISSFIAAVLKGNP